MRTASPAESYRPRVGHRLIQAELVADHDQRGAQVLTIFSMNYRSLASSTFISMSSNFASSKALQDESRGTGVICMDLCGRDLSQLTDSRSKSRYSRDTLGFPSA